MLFFYGMNIGLRTILKGRFSREAIKNIIIPINYWRTLEYRLVLNELTPNTNDKILDIGSPKLLSLYIADKYRSEVYSTDVEKYFIDDYKYFRDLKKISEKNYCPQVADGRNLEFPDNSFSKVYSISVFEHIPDDGDTLCIKEISRVLMQGGKCAITVPFSTESKQEYRAAKEFYWSASSKLMNQENKVFYQRRYNESDLYSRIIRPSNLELVKLQYAGERISLPRIKEIDNILHPYFGPIHPIFSYLFHTNPTDSWQNLKKPLIALIVLQKK